MSEIPDDVKASAEAAWADTKIISASLVVEDDGSDVLPYVITRTALAIMAERERCLVAAEAAAKDFDTAFRGLTALNAAAYMHGRAQSVVNAIRSTP